MASWSWTSVHCSSYPLPGPSARFTPSLVSATTPALRRTRARGQLQRCLCSQYAGERQPPPPPPPQPEPDSPQQLERLFSNLNQTTMKHEPGSVTSAVFLVAGTTVGAGILAIPAVTQEAGFLASAVICILCWSYMVVTGLLVAEVNVNTMCELGSGGVSLVHTISSCEQSYCLRPVKMNIQYQDVSMAMRTLGTFGVRTSWISDFAFLVLQLILFIYTLCTSCRIRGTLFKYHNKLIGHSNMGECYPVFSSFRRGMLLWKTRRFLTSQRLIGAVNGVLVVGILASFTSLVVVASGNLQWSSLLEANFAAAPQSIPIIALSFVYQNVVPVLCTNLEGDLSKVRTAIVAGTAIPLALFLVWDGVILGTLPDLAGSSTVSDPLELLRSSNGIVGPIVEAFSFLAIATSYIGFVLGISDFLADLLKLPSGQNKPLPYVLTLFPPLVLSLLDPEIFFKALDFAGTYGGKGSFTKFHNPYDYIVSVIIYNLFHCSILVLFGVFPAAMSWSERYSDELEAPVPPIVPGGKFTLSAVMGGALLVIVPELIKDVMQLQGLH
ncbi:Tyrosine-specific transport protein [Zea mays]|uniref:Tyrosine-specific transport protein n=2 Tax=Zea mays TaxID=4577 RepID=A0A3L6E2R2_MAIZE|nr:Tyrosine-specific transport protein [Zea mays]